MEIPKGQHSTEVINKYGHVKRSPYCLNVYFCMTKKIVHRQMRNQFHYIEPLVEDMLISIDWCETVLKNVNNEIYEKDTKEIKKYMKELIEFYKEKEKERYKKFLKRRPEILECIK